MHHIHTNTPEQNKDGHLYAVVSLRMCVRTVRKENKAKNGRTEANGAMCQTHNDDDDSKVWRSSPDVRTKNNT